MKNKKINGWKWAFLGQAALIVGFLLFLYTRFFIEKPIYHPTNVSLKKDSPNFKVVMTKKQFTVVTNKYLKQLNSKELNLNFSLGDNAQLTGSIKIFNQPLPFRLVMDVSVRSNKDLLLKPEEVSMGNLKISAQRILELIDSQVKMPSYIKVDPKQTEIVMALEQIQFSNELGFKIELIDLNNDRIVFNGYLNK